MAFRSVAALAFASKVAGEAPSPIRKVVTMIEEMKATVEKEGKEDLAAYDEYKCWCKSNGEEKKIAIEYATEQIGDLEAFIGEAKGTEGKLKTEISSLEGDIASDNSAIATATGVREKEAGEFALEETDLKSSIALITDAVDTISKAGEFVEVTPEVKTALIQVRNVVKKHGSNFEGIMQRDMFDMLGSFEKILGEGAAHKNSEVMTNMMLGEVFLPKREATALQQLDDKSAAPSGAAAGAKSYNSQGGQIVGLLGAMKDEMVRDLTAGQKEEFKALVDFQNLRAAKLAEIEATQKQLELTETALADLLDRAAKAAADLEAMIAAKAADEKFVAEMTENCQVVDQEYAARSKIRAEEVVALSETIEILTGDDARELFAKSVGTSFLQTDMSVTAQERMTDKVMKKLLMLGKKSNNVALLSLAVRVKLDAFDKVKKTMDNMLAELKTQQKNEYEQNERCKKEIDETEDTIKVETRNKQDLEEKNEDLTNTLATLNDEIKTLKQEVSDMEVSLKKAGIDRKAENELYQQSVADQRATITILGMALDRMKEFYAPKLVQIKTHQPVPGAAAAPPPPKPKAYEKSGGASGVLNLLQMVIDDAHREEVDLEADENKAQSMYGEFVGSSTASIEADRASIAEKEKHVAETSGELSKTEESQLANGEMLESLDGTLTGLHAECDYVMKYFKLRQQARQEEMDSIEEAKAILSGAKFGL
jgi:chromosome segregation ATPase